MMILQIEKAKEELQYWKEMFQLCQREMDVISASVSLNKSDIEAELDIIAHLEEQARSCLILCFLDFTPSCSDPVI